MVAHANRSQRSLAMLMLDLDHFKEVNDRFGHRAGDEALRDVAQLLVKHSRSFSIVTRYGGDEFAIILVNTAKGGGVTYADRIRGVIEQHHFAHTPVTVSLGIASIPEDAPNVDDLIVAADQALYDAKRTGRNRVAVP
jgi:diguanylate cyclase (GGDEF)-like protein